MHVERHFGGREAVRDAVLGLSDGLTVPFALAAGLSGAVASSKLVVTAGLAEIVAGAIAMSLGGYLAARGSAEHYHGERARERREVLEIPGVEENEVREIFASYGLTGEQIDPLVASLRQRPEAWVDFMMRFELGLEEPVPSRAWKSALTIGAAYALGGILPLIPYVLLPVAHVALAWSAAVTALALGLFGYAKGRLTAGHPWRSAAQMLLVGSLAAGAAFALARAVAG